MYGFCACFVLCIKQFLSNNVKQRRFEVSIIAARRFSCCAPPFGTVFFHLYALLVVSLVLGLSSRLKVFARHL